MCNKRDLQHSLRITGYAHVYNCKNIYEMKNIEIFLQKSSKSLRAYSKPQRGFTEGVGPPFFSLPPPPTVCELRLIN